MHNSNLGLARDYPVLFVRWHLDVEQLPVSSLSYVWRRHNNQLRVSLKQGFEWDALFKE